MNKKVANRGSATLEMTLLMPFLLGVLFLYINVFLFLLGGAQRLEAITQTLYTVEMSEKTKDVIRQGDSLSIYLNEDMGWFSVDLELHRKADTAVENIRRWQLARDVF